MQRTNTIWSAKILIKKFFFEFTEISSKHYLIPGKHEFQNQCPLMNLFLRKGNTKHKSGKCKRVVALQEKLLRAKNHYNQIENV
jgi:hypothetical protein